MTITTVSTAAIWIMVLVGAAGIVLAVLAKRVAAKVFAAFFAALIVLVVFAIRDHVVSLGETNVDALCAGRVSFFGVDLVGDSDRCPAAR
ncbi:hypothetical protein EH165_14055 [Nakamurella antarctica]|uniref:Uncharacterized protein n=1 Tax=Nakamurella antarctica TaxID=1902245 RepID=A0A3G8ZQL2_9ACTN|nr:hypothetical protein [Nakamurella antarctica]AZI59095.1 hypothetical protein EH165_14055 [Nakamurella antarctica]